MLKERHTNMTDFEIAWWLNATHLSLLKELFVTGLCFMLTFDFIVFFLMGVPLLTCLVCNQYWEDCRLPKPELEDVKVRQVDKRVAAAIRFNGKPTLEVVEEKKRILVEALKKDGLKLKGTFGLARYNDPGRTWPVFMVLRIWKKLHFLFCPSIPQIFCLLLM